jgi:hypothetical protein
MAGKKIVQRSSTTGQLVELRTVTVLADTPLATEIVALDTGGIINPDLLNAKSTSAGAGDIGKIPKLTAAGILDSTIVNSKTTSAGAGDSGKLVAADASGRIDLTFMPTGVGPDTALLTTSEIIASGDLVNIWNSSGAKVRKADATTAGKEAHGFVLVGGGSGATVTVYFEGTNTAITGLTPGIQYLDPATAGKSTATYPSYTTGQVSQIVGFATAATALNFQSEPPITVV